jgi:polar amino acid transport system substrate-binding protein
VITHPLGGATPKRTATPGRLGRAAAAVAGVAGLVVAGLAAPSYAATRQTHGLQPVKSIEKLVPASIRKIGVLTVPSTSDYPPYTFASAGNKTKVLGLSADLLNDAMVVLGLRTKTVIVNFTSIIPGFASKRYTLSLAAINVTPTRSKVVDFVAYQKTGTAFYVKSSSKLSLPGSYTAICGRTVAVEEGSEQATKAEKTEAHCSSIGKPTTLLQYTTQSTVNLAVQSGRAQVGLAANSLEGYLIKTTNGKFKFASPVFNRTTYVGFAVAKTSGMAKPLQAALQYLYQHGIYLKIFEAWNQQRSLVPPQIFS